MNASHTPPIQSLRVKPRETSHAKKPSFVSWFNAIWSLVLHCLLSSEGATLFLVYVLGRHFNVTERAPAVNIVEGQLRAQFNLLQSDVVTIFSATIVLLWCALIARGTPLIRRSAAFLMEKHGISSRNLRTLLHYGVLVPSADSSEFSSIVISLLIAVLAANFTSPILTASISWVPSNQLARGLSISPARFDDVEDGIRRNQKTSYIYPNRSSVRQDFVLDSIGMVSLGWGRNAKPVVLKQVSSSIEALAVNSTVENVTMPFFQVHSIQWIQDRGDIPAFRANGSDNVLRPHSQSTRIAGMTLLFGYIIQVHNTTTKSSSDPIEAY